MDEVAVQRMVSGHPPASHTRAERQEALSLLSWQGDWIKVHERTVQRLRKRILSGVDTLQLTG